MMRERVLEEVGRGVSGAPNRHNRNLVLTFYNWT